MGVNNRADDDAVTGPRRGNGDFVYAGTHRAARHRQRRDADIVVELKQIGGRSLIQRQPVEGGRAGNRDILGAQKLNSARSGGERSHVRPVAVHLMSVYSCGESRTRIYREVAV